MLKRNSHHLHPIRRGKLLWIQKLEKGKNGETWKHEGWCLNTVYLKSNIKPLMEYFLHRTYWCNAVKDFVVRLHIIIETEYLCYAKGYFGLLKCSTKAPTCLFSPVFPSLPHNSLQRFNLLTFLIWTLAWAMINSGKVVVHRGQCFSFLLTTTAPPSMLHIVSGGSSHEEEDIGRLYLISTPSVPAPLCWS